MWPFVDINGVCTCPLDQYNVTVNGVETCKCSDEKAELVDGVCQCLPGYIRVNGRCQCPAGQQPNSTDSKIPLLDYVIARCWWYSTRNDLVQ